jgi:hypothetical protein
LRSLPDTPLLLDQLAYTLAEGVTGKRLSHDVHPMIKMTLCTAFSAPLH